MKRDMNLIREILLKLEEREPDAGAINVGPIEGVSKAEISHHTYLLHEAGLIRGVKSYPNGTFRTPQIVPICLTWSGHDFLEEARDPERWGKAMTVMEGLGTFTIGVAREILTGMIRTQMGQ